MPLEGQLWRPSVTESWPAPCAAHFSCAETCRSAVAGAVPAAGVQVPALPSLEAQLAHWLLEAAGLQEAPSAWCEAGCCSGCCSWVPAGAPSRSSCQLWARTQARASWADSWSTAPAWPVRVSLPCLPGSPTLVQHASTYMTAPPAAVHTRPAALPAACNEASRVAAHRSGGRCEAVSQHLQALPPLYCRYACESQHTSSRVEKLCKPACLVQV